MKKLLFSFFFPLFVSLFLFPNLVKADTFNVSVPDNDFTFVNDSSDFYSFKQLILDKIANSDFNYYIIFYKESYDSNDNVYFNTSFDNLYARLYTVIPTFYFSYYSQRFNVRFAGTSTEFLFRKNPDRIIQSSSFPNLYINFWYNNNSYLGLAYLDSNFDFSYAGPDVINISSSHYSYTLENGGNVYSLYYLYSHTSLPSDDTPLLTQFFDISIEKLQLICEFFTSSYVYLSVFVIFIVYFIILFLRRLT